MLEAGAARVGHHAHDGLPRVVRSLTAVLDALAQRVFVGPEAARHRLVDNHDRRRLAPVALVEPSPADNRRADDAEVIRADRVNRRLDALFRFEIGAAVDAEIAGIGRLAEKDVADRAHSLHAGQGFDTLDQLLVEIDGPRSLALSVSFAG